MINDKEKVLKLYNDIFFGNIINSNNAKKLSINKINEKYIRFFEGEYKIDIEDNEVFRDKLYYMCSLYNTHYNLKTSKIAIKELEKLKLLLDYQIKTLCEYDIGVFEKKYPKILLDDVLEKINREKELTQISLISYFELYYMEEYLKSDITKLMADNPEDEYPDARNMKRHFVLHIGPTNSGKTYESIERLKQCQKGAYFGPLRLLALEIYDKLNLASVPCDMITGEEELKVKDAVCKACTIEMMNVNDYFDIVVIDEAQMIKDPYRGYNWTKAILGLKANEIHLCLAPEAKEIVLKLIDRCQDTYEIHEHERKTKLTFQHQTFTLDNVQQGDALIVFSKKSVLAVAAELQKKGIKTSVIYGNLPPASRRKQVELFTKKETDVVISTDAIGMGLNLPIKRIVFLETRKYDGKEERYLTADEIKQIAGRAGRMGMYEEGFVCTKSDAKLIESALTKKIPSIKNAYLGFPETLITLPFNIDDIMKAWVLTKSPNIYKKMDISILLNMYYTLCENCDIEEFNKNEIYQLITCPIDMKNNDVIDLWLSYCESFHYVSEMTIPTLFKYTEDLNVLETLYKQLDLYFQFSRKMKKDIDSYKLMAEKENVVTSINEILQKDKSSFVKRCRFCSKKLSFDYPYNICQKCHNKRYY